MSEVKCNNSSSNIWLIFTLAASDDNTAFMQGQARVEDTWQMMIILRERAEKAILAQEKGSLARTLPQFMLYEEEEDKLRSMNHLRQLM